jgi:hypothetical protein
LDSRQPPPATASPYATHIAVRDLHPEAVMRTSVLLGLAVMVSASTPACTLCGDEGDVREQITFRAAFQSDDGDPLFSTEVLVREGESGLFGPGGPWWEAAILDASQVEPGTGNLAMLAGDRGLALSLPLPRSAGDVIPAVKASSQTFNSFAFEPQDDRSVFPTDAAAIAYGHPVAHPCSREDPEACLPEEALSMQGTLDGMLEFVSTRPLRIRIDAIRTWPAESGWAPERIAGTLTFGMSRDDFCYNP